MIRMVSLILFLVVAISLEAKQDLVEACSKGKRGACEQACDSGSATGCYKLGNIFYKGKGISRDYSRAKAYYERACFEYPKGSRDDIGSAKGCNNLALLYKLGKGVKKQTNKAKQLYALSCDKGYEKACEKAGKKSYKLNENEYIIACHPSKLKPMMSCGRYVILSGYLNSSYNLERKGHRALILEELKGAKAKEVIGKRVVISAQCKPGMMTYTQMPNGEGGGAIETASLSDAVLIDVVKSKANMRKVRQKCAELKKRD